MSDWQEGTLEEIAEIIMGQSPKGESCNANGNGIPLLNGPTEFGIKYPTPVQFTDDAKKTSKPNDILFCVRGSTTGRMNWSDQCYALGRGLAAIRHKKGQEYRHFIKGIIDFSLPNLLASATGSTFPNVSRDQLEKLELSIPPLPEQKAIAAVLSSLDDKIDLLHRQNKTLEAMAETLFRQWFIEEAQENWEFGILGDVIEIFDGQRIPLSKMERDKKKEGVLYPYYGAAQIMDYINDYIFDGEYILLGEDGTVRTDDGYPVLQYATGKFWVNNHTHILKAKPPYNNFFLWNYLSKKNIDEIVTGAVQPKINQGNLKSLDFPKYPEELVIEFNKTTEKLFEKINSNKAQVNTLEKLRDTLLPKLMSGEVRIKLDEIQ
jgi:type I restriction enzyme S subunit